MQHRVVLQNLPTVVESYKTLDDANLVKVADIGQVKIGLMGQVTATVLIHQEQAVPGVHPSTVCHQASTLSLVTWPL